MKIINDNDATFRYLKIETAVYSDLAKIAGKWYFCPASYKNAFFVFVYDGELTAMPLNKKNREDLLDRVANDVDITETCIKELKETNSDWVLITWGAEDKPNVVSKYDFGSDYPYYMEDSCMFVFYNALEDAFYRIVTGSGLAHYLYMMGNKEMFPYSTGYSEVGKAFLQIYLHKSGIPGTIYKNQAIEGTNTQFLSLVEKPFDVLRNLGHVLRGRVEEEKQRLAKTKDGTQNITTINMSEFLLKFGDSAYQKVLEAGKTNTLVMIEVDSEQIPPTISARLKAVILNGTFIKFIVSERIRISEIKAYFNLDGFSVAISTDEEE